LILVLVKIRASVHDKPCDIQEQPDLIKVHQTLSRVGDSFDITNGLLLDVENFLYVVYAFPLIGDINEI
jgi:hypothetical protein